jgi:hypothetical protein
MGVPLQSTVLSVVLLGFLLLSAACYWGVAVSWRYSHLISSQTYHGSQSMQPQLASFDFSLQEGSDLKNAALGSLSKASATPEPSMD